MLLLWRLRHTHRLARDISEEGRKLSILQWTSLLLKKKSKIPSQENSIFLDGYRPVSVAVTATMKCFRCLEFQESGLLPEPQSDMNNFWALILRMDVFLGFFLAEILPESISLREVSDFMPRGRLRGSFQGEQQQSRDLHLRQLFPFFSTVLL